jgi:hypothetical protein
MSPKWFQKILSEKQAPTAPPDALAAAQAEIAQLRTALFDLHLEVEAIRMTLLNSSLGAGGAGSAYAVAYREAAFLTHDSTGPISGHDKLMALYQPPASEQGQWRECLFMQRLGFSADAIAKYKREAEEAHYYT